MKASGEYIVTIGYYRDSLEVGYCELSFSAENTTADSVLKHIQNSIKLPEGVNHYRIKGIYKL